MAIIFPLTNGTMRVVDNKYGKLLKYRRHAHAIPRRGYIRYANYALYVYAARSTTVKGKRTELLLHREIMEEELGKSLDGFVIHHKNRRTWDDRVQNLEMVSYRQNSAYRVKRTKAVEFGIVHLFNEKIPYDIRYLIDEDMYLVSVKIVDRWIEFGRYPTLEHAKTKLSQAEKILNDIDTSIPKSRTTGNNIHKKVRENELGRQPVHKMYMTPGEIKARIEYFKNEIKIKITERINHRYDSPEYMGITSRVYELRKNIQKWEEILSK